MAEKMAEILFFDKRSGKILNKDGKEVEVIPIGPPLAFDDFQYRYGGKGALEDHIREVRPDNWLIEEHREATWNPSDADAVVIGRAVGGVGHSYRIVTAQYYKIIKVHEK